VPAGDCFPFGFVDAEFRKICGLDVDILKGEVLLRKDRL
jgi:hypothetical protein